MLGLWGKGGFRKYWREVITLYDDLYFSRTVKNDSSFGRYLKKDSKKIGVDFLGSYDGDNVTYYYLVQYLPRELSIDFKDRLRKECKTGVRINFLNHLRGHKIDWDSTQMRSRLRVLKQVSDENNGEEVNSYNLHKNLGSLDRQHWIEDSLSYLAVADRRRNRSLMKSTVLVLVSGKRGEDFDDSIKGISDTAKQLGIGLERVLYNIPDLLRYFSPFKRSFNRSVMDIMPIQVLTDEIVARYSVYDQGTLGVSGITFGTDVYSRFPVLKRVKPREDTAENWIITAETGAGKSYTVKDLLLQLLSRNFNGTIMDIEGFEYIPLANFLSHKSKVVVINMAEGSGNYFDPVEITKPTGISEIDENAKTMALNFTLASFKTLLGKAYYEDTWMDTVVNDAVSEVYLRSGVTDDPSSWSNSEGLDLFSVYFMLKKLKDEVFREDVGYLSALEKSIALTGRYFEEGGTRRSVFSKKVLVSDIVDANLVICSFGMAAKSQHAVDEIQMALMQLGAAQLSHQRSIFSKSQGKFNFKVWEEFQRWGKFPDSDKTLGVAVTGGRKLGDVNIIVTNDIGQLLKDDKFGILSNWTSFMLGAISDERVRAELVERLSVPHMKDELDAISAAKRDSDEIEDDIAEGEADPLLHAFLCGLDKSKFGVVKIVLPPDIAKSKIFKTGVDLTV